MKRSVAVALVMLAPATASAQTWLVSIGNNVGRASEPELKYAESDADQVAAVMRQLGGVSPERELVLRGGDGRHVRTSLLRTNANIRRTAKTARQALIVYYSGHADAAGLHMGDTTMSYEELKAIVESSPARIRVLIVDSCRSGGITRVKGVKPAASFAIRLDDRLDVEGFAIITSSAGSEDSQESDTLRASFFTHHLLNALRGAADRDRDDRVTLEEAYAYAYQETLRSSGRTLNLQHPTYAYDLKGKGNFVLTRLAEGRGRFGALALSDPGTYLIFENASDGLLSSEVFVDDNGTRLLLTPGRYFVQRRTQKSYREYVAVVARGNTTRLADLDYREIEYSQLLRKGGGDRSALHNLSVATEVRGPIIDGFSVTPGILAGYGLDLSAISLAVQARFSRAETNQTLATTAYEMGIRLRADRYFDLDWFSLSIGALVEGVYVRQTYETDGFAPNRDAFIFGAGAALGIERTFDRFVVRAEGGPVFYVLQEATTSGGAIVGEQTQTPVTYWTGLNLGWRL